MEEKMERKTEKEEIYYFLDWLSNPDSGVK
jgi:hypothetical protein